MPARTCSCGLSLVMSRPSRVTAPQRQHSEDRLHRRRFAGAVGADDHDLAAVDGDGAAVQDVGAAVAAGHMLGAVGHGLASARVGLFLSPRPR